MYPKHLAFKHQATQETWLKVGTVYPNLVADSLRGAGELAVAGLAGGVLVRAVRAVVARPSLHVLLAVALTRLLAAGHVA